VHPHELLRRQAGQAISLSTNGLRAEGEPWRSEMVKGCIDLVGDLTVPRPACRLSEIALHQLASLQQQLPAVQALCWGGPFGRLSAPTTSSRK